jgi:Arc/MetJ family transcription regulator
MKTTIDIPDSVLRDAMRLAGATTKRQAVVTALTEYIQRGKVAALTKHLGSCADLMTLEELERLRNES